MKQFDNKTFRFFLLCFAFFIITSCSDKPRESIAFGINTAPVTLDPRFTTDAISYRISRLLYRSLVDFDDSFQAIPDLANWQAISPNHYRFRLQDTGREFHNGTRLTASDVKSTYDSVLNPDTTSPHRGSVEMIERIEVIDDDTVDFHLSRPDPLFPGRLVIGIMPADLIAAKHPFNQIPVGSGELRFVSWDDEASLLLKRTDGKLIKFKTVKDSTVRVLKLLRGEIDLTQGDLSPEMVSWLTKRDSVVVEKQKGNTFTYIGFNLQDEMTGNLKVRQAIAHAIDRDKIIQFVMGQNARKAGALFPSHHWVGHQDIDGVAYNPQKSIALLAELGYDRSSPLVLSYKTSNNPFRLRLATVIQSQLKQVGIGLNIQSYDWGTFYADIKSGRFQMYSLSWVGLKMPDIFRYVFHSDAIPPKGANRGRLIDSHVDSLIEQAESSLELETQAEYYHELQAYLLEVLPYVPLWYEDNAMAMSKNITGYQLSEDGNFDALLRVNRISND